mgnify:CR=1 FL=1
MQTNEQLLLAIENYLAQTEFPAEPERLYAPIGYSLAGGGKRLRPMLLMLAHGIFTDRFQAALPAAAAVEVFHNFTLLHDDIMDNAAVRRGKPSVYAKWGPSVAILSGDAMMICAYRLLSEVPAELLPRILGTFNTMALEVCEGQQYDLDFESKRKVSVVEYMHMIELKTSVLLAGSVTIGAMLGGASEEDCRKLRRFAIELGLAFQLQDDLLDSYGDDRLGKAIGGDILEGKQTYLMITAMSRADEATREVSDWLKCDFMQDQVGNIFSGQVVGETAKTLSERFGKVLQKRQSMTLSRSDKSTSISTQLDSLIPASKISTLTQGMFVGAVADNFDERIEQKIFHCEIVVDNEKVKAETARYKKIPQITDFTDENGTDHMKQVVQENYERIKAEAGRIVAEELERIKNDPVLCKLLPEQN